MARAPVEPEAPVESEEAEYQSAHILTPPQVHVFRLSPRNGLSRERTTYPSTWRFKANQENC